MALIMTDILQSLEALQHNYMNHHPIKAGMLGAGHTNLIRDLIRSIKLLHITVGFSENEKATQSITILSRWFESGAKKYFGDSPNHIHLFIIKLNEESDRFHFYRDLGLILKKHFLTHETNPYQPLLDWRELSNSLRRSNDLN